MQRPQHIKQNTFIMNWHQLHISDQHLVWFCGVLISLHLLCPATQNCTPCKIQFVLRCWPGNLAATTKLILMVYIQTDYPDTFSIHSQKQPLMVIKAGYWRVWVHNTL